MRALSSLTNRIFLACMLLATLSLGFAFYFVNERFSREAEAEVRRGLAEAGTLVDQHRATLTDTFTRLARLAADLPLLKAAVTTDAATVQPLAEDYREQMGADVLVVTDRSGERLGVSGFGPATLPASLTDVVSGDETSAFWPNNRGILQVVSVPIFIGVEPSEVLGRLTVGFFLDERRAQQFKDLTGSEIAFGAGDQILASTLPVSAAGELARAMAVQGMSTLTIGNEEYIALRRSLGESASGVEQPVVLILRSRTDRLRFLDTIRTGLAGALIVTLLLATIVSYGVARTMTRPLDAITHAMRDVAATGDLTRKVTIQSRGWDDEDARLLATTFNTLTDSIATFQREAALKDRLSSLGRLSTVIAHEIRNPLMIIRTSLRSLRRDTVTPAELREAVADIDEETTRLNRIVTEVLDFARPIRFDFAEARLNAICSASAHAAAAGETQPVIALDLDPSDPRLVTDAERLRTALVNVLTNARHAVQAAGVVDGDPGVRLETRQTGQGRVRITVTDRGVGIAADALAHIFDPYFTTRRTGSGLGLPIARNIIEGLGGMIAVTSRLGQGTQIRIELPEEWTGGGQRPS
jgi:signal transduction histidine kinase